MPNGPMRITSGPFEPDLYKSEMEVQDAELKVSVEWNMNMGHLWTSWKDFQSTALYDPTLLRTPASVFQALLQSSASRKTQKKKKKKVCDVNNGWVASSPSALRHQHTNYLSFSCL